MKLSLPLIALISSFASCSLAQDAPAPPRADPAITAALTHIDPANIRADIAKLVSFGTRTTISSVEADLPAGRGINPATDWVESEFKRISAACGNCLDVKRDTFDALPSATVTRLAKSTRLTNVYAILHGTSADAPWVLVTGHIDSRLTDIMDPRSDAPGANDDASGVAVSLESARVLSQLKFPGTIVFVAVAGEEQGLLGSAHLAQLAKKAAWPLQAVLNNDIVGGDTTPGDNMQDKHAVRVFSENIPGNATPAESKRTLTLGAENDSPSRELARSIAELAPAYIKSGGRHAPAAAHLSARPNYVVFIPAFHPVMINRADRYLRGGDHTSFNAEGFAAVRFTEWRENFDHQHQLVRVENGTEYGDLLKFVELRLRRQRRAPELCNARHARLRTRLPARSAHPHQCTRQQLRALVARAHLRARRHHV